MKLLLTVLSLITLIFSNANSIEKKKCETALQKALPACWQQLEPGKLTGKLTGKLKKTKVMSKIGTSHENLEDKKKAFDEKNKTLWDMFKNSKK